MSLCNWKRCLPVVETAAGPCRSKRVYFRYYFSRRVGSINECPFICSNKHICYKRRTCGEENLSKKEKKKRLHCYGLLYSECPDAIWTENPFTWCQHKKRKFVKSQLLGPCYIMQLEPFFIIQPLPNLTRKPVCIFFVSSFI